MRKTLLFLVLVTLASCSNLQFLNSFDGFHDKPEIVEIKTYKVEYDEDAIVEKPAYSEIIYYDLEGRKIKRNTYKSDGTTDEGDRLYEYDKNGLLLKEVLYKKDGSVQYKIENEYNQFGQLIINDFSSEKNKMVREFTFDRLKKTSKLIRKNQDGAILERATFKYDKQWRVVELKELNKDNTQTSRIEFFYDERGNQILSKWYNSENHLTIYYNSVYNAKNQRTKVERYHVTDGKAKYISSEEFEYTYDNHQNVIEKKSISNGKISWITRYNYTYFR